MNIRIITCDKQIELSNQIKATITTFFPCHYFIKPITFLEKEIERYFKKEEYKYSNSDDIENFLIIFWDHKDPYCKQAINNAKKHNIPTLLYYVD